MSSLAKGEMGPTTHAVERNHIATAAANPVKIESVSDHILRRGAKSESCKASPPVDNPDALEEIIDPLMSLHIDGTKETAAAESHSDEDLSDESDSDWYTSDNDESQTKAYPPFSKSGSYSFDLANADWEISNRRYFTIPEPSDVPSNFCWGTDPRSPHITYLYEVRFTPDTVLFYRCHMFNHSDSNDGPCPRAIGHHFFQPTGTIYRQKNGELGYVPVEVYNDQQAIENYLLSQGVDSQLLEPLAFAALWADSGLANQVVGNDQRLEFFTPPSSQDASLLSSPHHLDGGLPLTQDPDSSGPGRGVSIGLAPDQDMFTSSRGSQFVYSSSNTSESSVCAYSPGVRPDVLQQTIRGGASGAEEIAATPGASSSATDQSFDDLEWPDDEDQVIRMSGLAPTVEDIDRYLKTFLKRLKEKKKTEVYCWDCRFGERRRSVEKSRQKYLKPSALKRHLLIHLRIETFSCEEEGCDYVTTIEDNLNRHQDEVHKKSSRAAKGRATRGARVSSGRPTRGDTIRPPR